MNGDKCGHSGDRLSQNDGGENKSKRKQRGSLYFRGLENLVYEILRRLAHAFVVCNDYFSVCRVFEIYDNIFGLDW